jgi:hypothetical protein
MLTDNSKFSLSPSTCFAVEDRYAVEPQVLLSRQQFLRLLYVLSQQIRKGSRDSGSSNSTRKFSHAKEKQTSTDTKTKTRTKTKHAIRETMNVSSTRVFKHYPKANAKSATCRKQSVCASCKNGRCSTPGDTDAKFRRIQESVRRLDKAARPFGNELFEIGKRFYDEDVRLVRQIVSDAISSIGHPTDNQQSSTEAARPTNQKCTSDWEVEIVGTDDKNSESATSTQ